jgi:hypothetical protein
MQLRPSHELSSRPSAAEFALAAAARVSCCAALVSFACHRSTSESPAEVQTDDALPPAEPLIIAEPDLYVSNPDLDPSLNRPPVSQARLELESCQSQVSATVEGGTLGPEADACCRMIAKNVYEPVDTDADVDAKTLEERRTRDQEVWWKVSGQCCDLIGFREAAACSPWGPPTPPSVLATSSEPAKWLDLRSFARVESLAGIAAPDESLRRSAIATWRARMVNEYGSAPVFEGLLGQLEALVRLGLLDDAAIDRARSFPKEERRHGILCGAVVEALGGAAEAEALPEREFPRHPDAKGDLEACLRNLLSICCLSETVAVALIAAERYEMPAGPLRQLLTGIWADECGHANFGWRLLPELLAQADAETLAGLAEYLRLAFGELEAHELAHLPADFVPAEGGEVYGLCNGAEARALFRATVERVIVPGLEARGLPAQRAWDTRFAA